jgi:hypothetical protein
MDTGVRKLENEANNSTPSSAKLRIHPSVRLNGVDKDSFIFTLVFH